MRPDYNTLRDEQPFSWAVRTTYLALLDATDTTFHDFALNPDVAIKVFREGRPIVEETYGPDVGRAHVHSPPISYGHANGLGCELLFPEEGEVAHAHAYQEATLQETIDMLEQPVDFAKAGMAPFYLDFYETLKKEFPDEGVGFSYGLEGPLTTAYELRGDTFFTDPFDDPDRAKLYLKRLTDSILDFHRFRCSVTGAAPMNDSGGGLADDLASMIPDYMFDEFVIPFWDQYYRGMTTGRRSAHVENLRAGQLKYLETIGLSQFDPSISPALSPKIIRDECRVPFQWRLGTFHYRYMSHRDLRDFVLQAAADGACSVWSTVSHGMLEPETVDKVHTFIAACKEAESMLKAGRSKEDLAKEVSPEGREKFWDHWPE